MMTGAPNGAATGSLVHGGLGSAADLAGVDAAAPVLLLDRGVITFAEKALNAEARRGRRRDREQPSGGVPRLAGARLR